MAKVLYFARFRDAIGIGEELVDLVPSDNTLGALCIRLRERGGGYAVAFKDLEKVRGAIDLAMAPLDAPLGFPGEIAFFPPVTGG
ncbi:MoaD/ThiS family protein [Sphingomonas sp.]|uniref:MoaD/ThiS family protein n=1 Tax=Sphingomonas sp. TaxID=28214 RepID=UPI0025E9EDF1|nr:MoaD/ThiS family protein [Sphingomonas sp.]